jgi:hypothetical protein
MADPTPLQEPCFLCGAPAVKREWLVTGRTSVQHPSWSHHDPHHHHHPRTGSATTRELKPLCAPCLAEQERQAAEAAKVLGAGLAVAGTAFGATFLATFLLPLVFCLGGGVVLAVAAFVMNRH